MQRSLAVFAVLLAAGCAAPQPRNPPAEFVLRWNTRDPALPPSDDNPPSTVTVEWNSADFDFNPHDMAERHCEAWNQRATPLRQEDHGPRRVAVFACVPPPPAG